MMLHTCTRNCFTAYFRIKQQRVQMLYYLYMILYLTQSFSLFPDEDTGPDFIHRVHRSLQAILNQSSLDVQNTGCVIEAAVINHVLNTVVKILHHQLLGCLQHALWGRGQLQVFGFELCDVKIDFLLRYIYMTCYRSKRNTCMLQLTLIDYLFCSNS